MAPFSFLSSPSQKNSGSYSLFILMSTTISHLPIKLYISGVNGIVCCQSDDLFKIMSLVLHSSCLSLHSHWIWLILYIWRSMNKPDSFHYIVEKGSQTLNPISQAFGCDWYIDHPGSPKILLWLLVWELMKRVVLDFKTHFVPVFSVKEWVLRN